MKGLYLVTPDWEDTARLLAAAEAALEGGARMLQYRHKSAAAGLRREQASGLLALCRRHGVPLIINDHVDLCLALDADGVHVGGTDVPVREARRAVGPSKIVGVSCYGELQRARDARAAGASYLAFGGFYPSLVKRYTFRTGFDLVREARAEFDLPLVVIGGMTPENAAPLVGRGADMVAAISAVFAAADPKAAAQSFGALFTQQEGATVAQRAGAAV